MLAGAGSTSAARRAGAHGQRHDPQLAVAPPPTKRTSPISVASQLAEIFATDVDFHRELRRGDSFRVSTRR
jgi:hypothetical protein